MSGGQHPARPRSRHPGGYGFLGPPTALSKFRGAAPYSSRWRSGAVPVQPPAVTRRDGGHRRELDMELGRNLARRKLRTGLTITGIAVGIWALVVFGALATKIDALVVGRARLLRQPGHREQRVGRRRDVPALQVAGCPGSRRRRRRRRVRRDQHDGRPRGEAGRPPGRDRRRRRRSRRGPRRLPVSVRSGPSAHRGGRGPLGHGARRRSLPASTRRRSVRRSDSATGTSPSSGSSSRP